MTTEENVAQFTAGPWEQSAGDEYAIFASNGAAIATVLTSADFPCLDDGEQLAVIPECEANARLIAAAPDLLAACEAASALATACMAQGCYSHDELTEMARATRPKFAAAIAKARLSLIGKGE